MSDKLFTDLGLSAESLQAIARLGFEQPSPIQAESIPPLMAGRDLVGQSQTGSGKTAAFALPAIERIDSANRAVQVLILCNTRELAIQVREEVHKLAYFKSGVRPLPIYGGQSYDRQISGLRSGANLVIGTPGRIMDHMQRGTLILDKVKMVILDEADEMLNMGFRDDMEFILRAVPADRQTVLFSATIPRPIEDLIARYTKNPERIQIQGKAMTVPTVDQAYVEVDRRWKAEALERLIDLHDVTRGLIFCNTQRMVDELTELLNVAGYGADSIHGGMAQAQRDRVMKKFKQGGLEFLVATDVAARGIDVDDIQVVFNYDMPYDGEDYVHRVGRTGRAGRKGLAISFASGRDRFVIQQIERFTRQRMRRIEVPSPTEIEEARLNQLVNSVRATIEAGDFRHYDHLIEGLLEDGIDSLDLANALLHQLSGAAGEGSSSGSGSGDRKPTRAPAKPVARPEVRPPAAGSETTPAVSATSPSPAVSPLALPGVAAVPSLSSAPSPFSPAPATAPPPKAKVAPPAPVAATPSTRVAAASKPGAPLKQPAEMPAATTALAASIPVAKPVPPPSPADPQSVPPPAAVPPVRRPILSIPPPPMSARREREDPRSHKMPLERGMPSRHSEGPRPPMGRPGSPSSPGEPPTQRYNAAVRDERPAGVPRPVAAKPALSGELPTGQPRSELAPPAQNAPRKPTRPRPGSDKTRLWIGVGLENNVTADTVKACILGETGVPAETVSNIDLRERHSFVDINSDSVAGILAKLNRAQLAGKRLKAKVA